MLGLGGCEASGGAAGGSPTKSLPPTIQPDLTPGEGFVVGIASYSVETPFWSGLVHALEARAVDVGMTVVSKDANGDAAQLGRDVEELLAQGVSGVIVVGGDLTNAPGVAMATKSSTRPLVLVGRIFDAGNYTAAIAADYTMIGAEACDFIRGAFGGRGKVALIEGDTGGRPNEQQVASSFRECLVPNNQVAREGEDELEGQETAAEKPMQLVETTKHGDWTEAGGESVMATLLAEHSDIAAVFCLNDAMCLGAQKAAARAGHEGEMVFIGVGGSDKAFQAIMDGTDYLATFLIDPNELGWHGIDLMVRILKRQDFSRNSFMPASKILMENAEMHLDSTRHL
ncbi:MAG: substrate-binding domain-containing protein [Micrococcales bacterium]|nr:substrate-binding domain-containing protein [Micrococcales bacterium]